MYTIKVFPSEVSIQSPDDKSILDGALNSGVSLEHSCKTGACGACKAKVLSGDINNIDPRNILSEDEIEAGFFLTCVSKALSDCEIEANYFPELSDIYRKLVPAKVDSIDVSSLDVAIIKLRLPPSASFKFRAGQYIDLLYAGLRRSYSIANSQECSSGIELHIKAVHNGKMSTKIFKEFKKDTLIRIDGPIGTFFLRSSNRPIIFVAGGTGFAPVKAMIEELLHKNDKRPIYIYWGSTTSSGFYSSLAEDWASEYEHINFIPVVSGEDPEWDGRVGLVHKSVLEDFGSLEKFDVYACGSPLMIEAARKEFEAFNLPKDRFFSDAFIASDN